MPPKSPYPQNLSGDDYYPINAYCVSSDNSEIYATLKNLDQIYRSENGIEILALKMVNGKREPYFASDKDGNPICPVLNVNMKYIENDLLTYPIKDGREIYPRRDNREYYIYKNKRTIFAKDKDGLPYYAIQNGVATYGIDETNCQSFILDKNNKPVYIEHDNTILYPLNLNTNEPIYPKTPENDEYYLKKGDLEIYGLTASSLPRYARDKTGSCFFAVNERKEPYYASYKNFQFYPKLHNKKQFYLTKNNSDIYIKQNSSEIYALLEDGNPFFAKKNNLEFYAMKSPDFEYYPTTVNGDNFYKRDLEKEIVAVNRGQGYYAKKSNQSEFYPKHMKLKLAPLKINVNIPNAPRSPTDIEIQQHIA